MEWALRHAAEAQRGGVSRYVPLDIFHEILHNRGIKSKLDAWLMFFCEDAPEMIELLIRQDPYFRELYNDVYKLCGNMGDIMGAPSKGRDV